jgi:predicted kinase
MTASGCPRCDSAPCVIAPAATMADLWDGVRVRERSGPWPLTGTVRVIDSGSELRVHWDPRKCDGMRIPSSTVLAEGPAGLGDVLPDEIELVDREAAAVPLAAAAQAAREAIEAAPCLVMLIGPAGSGKSTMASQLAGGGSQVLLLGLDALRAAVSGNESDQDATGDAVAALHLLARARLSRRLTTVIDATNVTAQARQPLLDLARQHGVPAVALVLATTLQTCLARNKARPGPPEGGGRRVPEHAVRSQHHARLLLSPAALAAEGFTLVITCAPDAG